MKMLTIRPEQMTVLRQYMRDTFQHRMMAHLRERFTGQTKDLHDAELLQTIDDRMDQANTYGVRTEQDVRRFLEYAIELGPGFPTGPSMAWARRILEDRTLNGTRKMNQIDDQTTFSRRSEP